MASLLNKDGVQYYSTQMVKAENRKVNGKPLPSVLNEIDSKLDEMKTLFDEEYGTALDMKLENGENVFSVGTGIDINKKDEVENGFTDIELSGNSLVNLCPVRTISHTKIDDVQLYSFKEFHCPLVKVNTTYTVFVNITKNPNSVSGMTLFTFIHNGGLASDEKRFTNQTGYQVFTLTTKNMEVPKGIKFRFANSHGGDLGTYECTDLVILEGDWTNKPIPQYFEGMKSVGQDDVNGHKIEILSTTKNLFNGWQQGGIAEDGSLLTSANEVRSDFIRVKSNTQYICSNNGVKRATHYIFYDKNKQLISSSPRTNPTEKFITPSNCGYVRLTGGSDLRDKFQLEIGDVITSYSSVNGLNKKEISLNEPLRNLPNGVKDTIEKINGEWKIVRRCVQIVLNGTEGWNHEHPSQEDGVNTALFASGKLLDAKDFPQLCDRFIAKNSNLMLNSHPDSEGVGCWSAKNNVNIRINKNRLSTVDVDGFKAWLSQNPTKVLFELKTPIIEDVSPVTLQCWKNGTIFIDEVLPVESTHTVALNKGAQIQRNIEELTELRNRVKNLEETYEQLTLDQTYQLALLNNSIKLDNK